MNVVVTSELDPHENRNMSSEPEDLDVEVETGSDDEEETFRAKGVPGGRRWVVWD